MPTTASLFAGPEPVFVSLRLDLPSAATADARKLVLSVRLHAGKTVTLQRLVDVYAPEDSVLAAAAATVRAATAATAPITSSLLSDLWTAHGEPLIEPF